MAKRKMTARKKTARRAPVCEGQSYYSHSSRRVQQQYGQTRRIARDKAVIGLRFRLQPFGVGRVSVSQSHSSHRASSIFFPYCAAIEAATFLFCPSSGAEVVCLRRFFFFPVVRRPAIYHAPFAESRAGVSRNNPRHRRGDVGLEEGRQQGRGERVCFDNLRLEMEMACWKGFHTS